MKKILVVFSLLKKTHVNFYLLFVGIVSFIWLIVRSGTKPSRLNYPCQKAAAANFSMILPGILINFSFISNKLGKVIKRSFNIVLIFLIVFFALKTVLLAHKMYKTYIISKSGPVGKILFLNNKKVFSTIPRAMSLQSPHRVVSVQNEDATSYNFAHTTYYGSNTFVNQTVVDNMFDRGIRALTNQTTLTDAWKTILPDYSAGKKIAVKVNFNCSIMGGGISGYGDNDAFVDALPQVVNSIVYGLKLINVAEEDIIIFDASRHITNRFRSLILYPNIKYYDHYGGVPGVEYSGFTSTLPSAQIDFSGTTYSGSHRITDILVNADYLINVPIMKRHGGAGVTLALKNHLGTIDGFFTGGANMHNWFYLNSSNYSSSSNPMVNINLNTHIKDKTILIVGEALYGGWNSNNTPPTRWGSFGNDSPNMLFFSVDPVAIDSVMYDYLNREGYVNPLSQDVMIIAALNGLGVYERWNNNSDRKYTQIDYIELASSSIDLVAPNNLRLGE